MFIGILIVIIVFLFFYILGSKSASSNNETNSISHSENDDKYSEYFKIMDLRPKFRDYYGRDMDYPKYNDKYNTGTEFKLRQLLLLVWFSRTKKGRLVTTSTPQYFYYDYNINGNKLLQHFIARGWIIEDDERYILSDEGKKVAKQYAALWELHRNNQFPFCLDEDYPNWNDGKLLKKYYEKEIQYFKAFIEYDKKLINFYKETPSYFTSKEEQQHEIQAEKADIERLKHQINKDRDKISLEVQF
ncbi:MAG: hypothetical protein N5846_02875 [Lactobacillus gasseri]|nr:hypothetical protein [Lactobacillus gasseri]